MLDLGKADIYTVLSVNEAITRAVDEGKSQNTIRFMQIKPPTVTVGYFQSVKEEVDIAFCRKSGIDIARRWTGGGGAYEDHRAELTYAVAARLRGSGIPIDFEGSFKHLCQGPVIGLRKLGANARFGGINDLIADGKKIGGTGQSRLKNALLLEGSILLDDAKDMFQALIVSAEKIRDKGIGHPSERVTSLKRELGRKVPVIEVKKALREGFEQALNVRLVDGELSDYELRLIDELRKKYGSEEWIFRR